MTPTVSRRAFLQSSGALIIAFALPLSRDRAQGRAGRPAAPGDAPPTDQLDAWLAIGSDDEVTLYSGKVELGTGVQTAITQIVAEELDVPVERIRIVQGTTDRTPNQGPTVGSKTVQVGGMQIRRAAAAARQVLLELAAARLGVPATQLAVEAGVISVPGDRARAVSYGALIGNRRFERTIPDDVPTKSPSAYRVVGQPVPRVELPAKVFGTHPYVHNVRLPGMLHGRVVRPPVLGATLESVDEHSVRSLPGVVAVVRRGNFLGVVAEEEAQAVAAAGALAATWAPAPEPLPGSEAVYEAMRMAPATERVLTSTGNVEGGLTEARTVLTATYRTPFQSHGSIGPSCAVAEVREGRARIWSATQGTYALRDALAELLDLPPERVEVIWAEGSGCYGHNGADDAAADAALLSQAVGRPVRVQWSRADEHGWDPKGPAMEIEVRGGLDATGTVVAWDYTVTTPTHSTRPSGHAGNLLAGRLVGRTPRAGTVGGDRNARHDYAFPNDRVRVRWIATSALRSSALRGLGAPANVFATESFLDELAAAAHVDPIRFRLRYLRDPRAIAVLERVAELARWSPRPSPIPTAQRDEIATGRGVAYARYENAYTYVATVAEVEVDRRSGAVRVPRLYVAHDCGLIINPDGLRNQIEGATIQTLSRTLKEAVRFDRTGVTSLDWRSYPILTFPEIPESIEIALIDRPDAPPLGAGEPAACTVPAAVGNAIFDATGVRLRTIPFTPERVQAALSA